jgi:hypothetical protein
MTQDHWDAWPDRLTPGKSGYRKCGLSDGPPPFLNREDEGRKLIRLFGATVGAFVVGSAISRELFFRVEL